MKTMKTKKRLLALSAALAAILILAGCEWDKDDDDDDHRKQTETGVQTPDNPGTQNYYTVEFVIVGGPAVPASQTVKYGEKAAEPVVRDFSNNVYTVVWYADQLFTMPYSFNAPVIGNITLYGKWQQE